MTVRSEDRELVRRRAGFACEFCGVHEVEAGGELTIDHFQPQTKGGSDRPDNLLYCCPRCNQYKADYWPVGSEEGLWNPRRELAADHFAEIDDGRLQALTPTGAATLRRLQLNRPALVAYRLRRHRDQHRERLLRRYRELNEVLERLLEQQAEMIEGLHLLLKEQRLLLQWLLDETLSG